jgi:dihydroxyacetone kinase-like protein
MHAPTKELNLEGLRLRLLGAADAVLAEVDTLTHADQAVGDGDHGIGMERGFTAVKEKLAGEFSSISQMLGAVGQALMLKVGGSSGAIFGTLFSSGSKAATTARAETLNAAAFADFLQTGLEAVQKRGNAKVGDKTMVDALAPAAEAARANASGPIDACLHAAAEAAQAGMESTKNMVATLGRAKILGDRALGHPDPGAISMALILRGMAMNPAEGSAISMTSQSGGNNP